jgi:hypothetical protein
MGYKIVKLKNGEARIDYYKVKDQRAFRYETLKKLLGDHELIIKVDTNMIKSDERHLDISRYYERGLKERNIPYEVIPTEKTNHKKILGITYKKDDEKAYLILFNIYSKDLTEDFFNEYLANTDLDIGIAPSQSFEELYRELQKGYFSSFVNSGYFGSYIYDSNYIGSMRLSKEIDLQGLNNKG